ncbi:MAG TPA: PQQ-binding-like beta-propeller repeat protein [Gemmataceae bacterium]|jgi:outer membrane protein assembly factor BamB|nr:PQQ-binding-like beta-propeller repeat protein [Gemmataceae bacterium]
MFVNHWRRLCLMLIGLGSSAALAADWPAWRGADRTGVSPETGLLQEWPKEGPKLLWKATGLGAGYSSTAIVGDRIYTMGNRGNDEYALCLDAGGKQIWEAKVGPTTKGGPGPGAAYPGPRATPTVVADRVYVLGSDGDLVCLDTAGKEQWRKNLEKDLGGKRGMWDYSESPLIDGDVLVCTPGGPESSLAALNAKTGEVIWKATVPEGGEAAYASPVIAETGGQKEYVQFLRNGVAAVSAKDGKFLWLFGKEPTRTNCCTPIVHDGYVFESHAGPGGSGCALLKLTPDAPGYQEVYAEKKVLDNHHGGVVLVRDYLYGTTGQSLACVELKTGKEKWNDRSVGKGSIAAADGRLYVRGEKGTMALVEATPAGYKERGKFEQPSRSKWPAWPHPVIANGKLYLRDDDVLLCYDVKTK